MTSPSPSPSPAADGRSPKSLRIRRRSEFVAIQDHGRKLHTPSFLVFVRPAPTGAAVPTRVGITVTRKVGNAVERNRIKRLVREAVRRHKLWFPPGREVVFVAKRGAVGLGESAVEQELERLCKAHFART